LDYDYVLHIVNFASLYDTNLDEPDIHFDYLGIFSGTLAEKVGNPEKSENCIRDKKKCYAMKLSQIPRWILLCMSSSTIEI
jgi:hypothetical protein